MDQKQHKPIHCLYFTTNLFARHINLLAQEVFAPCGMAPSHAYLMLTIIRYPGSKQQELAEMMNLHASTMTRFVDKLIQKGMVERFQEGRSVTIFPTEKGFSAHKQIEASMARLYQMYCTVLGEDFSSKLSSHIQEANNKIKTGLDKQKITPGK